jgi:uncharacterized protein YdaU (DUF1376 family)
LGGCLNFYPHHIGDYLTATAHLTWQEDCAYRRLLDVYYSREQALPTEIAQACRLVRATSKDERKAVETVLVEFFTLTDSGWSHARCEAEIVKAKEAAERARVNGKKGGRPPKQKPTDNPEETQPVISGNPEKSNSQAPNPNPITNNSVPIGTGAKAPMSPDEIIFGYGVTLLINAGTAEKQARSFLGGLRKGHGDAALIDSLRECAKARPLQPLEWLAAALPPGASAGKPNRQEAIEKRNREAADRWAEQGETHVAH